MEPVREGSGLLLLDGLPPRELHWGPTLCEVSSVAMPGAGVIRGAVDDPLAAVDAVTACGAAAPVSTNGAFAIEPPEGCAFVQAWDVDAATGTPRVSTYRIGDDPLVLSLSFGRIDAQIGPNAAGEFVVGDPGTTPLITNDVVLAVDDVPVLPGPEWRSFYRRFGHRTDEPYRLRVQRGHEVVDVVVQARMTIVGPNFPVP